MKKSLLVALLLLPLAIAKPSAGSQIIPVPDCYPCDPDTVTVASASKIIPVPDCYPCDPDTVTVASASKIVPVPDCYPCDPDTLRITVQTKHLASVVRGLRREA